jgi:hypothetical protein
MRVIHDTSRDHLYAGIVAVGATCDGAPVFANKQDQFSTIWLGHCMHPEPPYGMPKAALRQVSICSMAVAERRPKTRKINA